jgi:hypothetical protein
MTHEPASFPLRVSAAARSAVKRVLPWLVRARQAPRLERELEKERQAHDRLRRHVRTLPRHEWGSLTPGVDAWSERWRERTGRRVLLFARKDYGGSLMRWAEALNTHTDWAARHVVLFPHEYRYPLDLVYTPELATSEDGLSSLVADASAVHVKDETLVEDRREFPKDFFAAFDVPLVFQQYGGFARAYADLPAYRAFVGTFAARIALTPDLNFDWFDGAIVPQAIDVARYPYAWHDGRRLAHSPTSEERKGTSDLRRAVEGLDVELDIISGVSYDESVERKASCNLFFDQAGREQVSDLRTDRVIGWYGNSALEAAVRGIPTIAHLSEDAFAGGARAGLDLRRRCAIVNTPLGSDGIRETIEAYFRLTPEEREALSHRTRAWVEEFHSYEATGAALAAVYDSVAR